MNKKLTAFGLFVLLLSGCATIHEKCSDPDFVSEYKDYNQCYAELSAAQQRRIAALQSMNNSFQKMHQSYQSQTTNCTSNGLGGYRCVTQ